MKSHTPSRYARWLLSRPNMPIAARLHRLPMALPGAVFVALLASQHVLCAQAPALPARTSEPAVELKPFVVDSTKDTGYAAQNTLSGTRLNSPVADLGVTLTIFTPEVWTDLSLSSTNELINYTPGAEINYSNTFFFGDAVKFRGILVENILRNSFKSNVPNDSYNADRMEFSRGPNAILVNGSSTTGGVNRSTVPAVFKDQNRVLFRADSHGTFRTELDVNRGLIRDQLAARVVVLHEDAKTWREPIGFKEQRRYYGALKWKPVAKVTADASYEKIDWGRSLNNPYRAIDRVTPFLNGPQTGRASNSAGPAPAQPQGVANFAGANTTVFVDDGNPATPAVQNWRNYAVGAPRRALGTGFDLSVPAGILADEFDIVGNGRTQYFDGHVLNLGVQVDLARNLYATFGYNREFMRYDFVQDPNSSFLQVDASTTLPDGITPNPNFGRFFMGGDSASNRQDRNFGHHRLALAYKLDQTNRSDALKWVGRHDFSVAVERERMDQKWDRPRLINSTPLPGYAPLLNNAENRVRVITYLEVKNNTLVSDHSPLRFTGNLAPGVESRFLSETAGDTFSRRLNSALAVWQSRFWNDRIVGTVGFRKDYVLEYQAAPFTAAANGLAPNGHERGRIKSANSGTSPETRTTAVVFHAIKEQPGVLNGLSFYYNRSDAVTLLFPELLIDGRVRPNTIGKTSDFGLRFQALGNRIGGVLTVFDTKSQNERINAGDWLGRAIAIDRALGNFANAQPADVQDLASKGYEFQLTANLTRNWRLSASYNHFQTLAGRIGSRALGYIAQRKDAWLARPDVQVPDYNFARVADVYRDLLTAQTVVLAQEGTRTLAERRNKFTLLTNYAFTEGPLKGWAIGGDVIWTSAPNVAFGNKSLNGLVVVDPNVVFYGSTTLTGGLHASYVVKNLFRRVDCKFQLNITNVANSRSAQLESALVQPGSLQNVPVPLLYRVREPRAFVLTSTFRF
ncbi:MAG: hypothetical protein JNK23_03455 [Opitutaceae bacterium]|nr:hypothetical protein [Opitutaceae bacterium]